MVHDGATLPQEPKSMICKRDTPRFGVFGDGCLTKCEKLSLTVPDKSHEFGQGDAKSGKC